MLLTLGGLALRGTEFRRQKPLLLLAYLALEGQKERRYVAELFWPRAAHSLTSLSVALSQIRKVAPDLIEADQTHLKTTVLSDSKALLACLEEHKLDEAINLYVGGFSEGLSLELGEELEEWLYRTREYIAAQVRSAILKKAELAIDLSETQILAEKAYSITSSSDLNFEEFEHFYKLFSKTKSHLLKTILQEASEYGLDLEQIKLEDEVVTEISPPNNKGSNNLPKPLTTLVGRDPELFELGQLLIKPECRLVTILGIGGIGKTKLALHTARELSDQNTFVAGIYFVELESLHTAEEVLPAIADTIDLDLVGNESAFEQVSRYISDKDYLLVIDNFEHVTDAALNISELLRRCIHLKVVITSREKLRLAEEWIYELEGLAVPDETVSIDEALAYDAIQLFWQRAKRVSIRFNLDATNLHHIIRICNWVEGSPLGIELAASWVPQLALVEIANEIEANLDFLQVDYRNLPERHRSLRAAFEQSWQLLTLKEQRILAELAVFRGGFSRQAAAVVVGATLPELANLVNKSLLRVSETTRFDRHPMIYQYSLEKLTNAGEFAEKHAAYYLAPFESYQEAKQGSSLRVLKEDTENISDAFVFALKSKDLSFIENIIFNLVFALEDAALYRVGDALLTRGLHTLDKTDANQLKSYGRLLLGTCLLKTRLGEFALAANYAEEAAPLLEQCQDREGLIWRHYYGSFLHHFKGEQEKAKEEIEIVLSKPESVSDSLIANSFDRRGTIHQAMGDYDAAKQDYKQSLVWHRKLDNKADVVTVLLHLGTLELNTGIFMGQLEPDSNYMDVAKELYLESLSLGKEIGKDKDIPILLHNLANIAMKQGDYPQAYALAKEALSLVQERGEKNRESGMLATLGWIALTAGDLQDAAKYIQMGLSLAHTISDQPSILTNLIRIVELWEIQGYKEQAIYLARYVASHQASLAWTSNRAKRFLDTWQVSLDSTIAELLDINDLAKHLTKTHLQTLPILH